MDRRKFVRTTGGILVAASVGGCGSGRDGNGPPTSGTVRVLLTGLDASATSGGTAVVTPVAGGTPVNIDLPASGDQSAQVPVGDYSVQYTPPTNHELAPGEQNPRTVTITGNTTTTVTIALVFVPPSTTGTLQINVTGLTGAPANGGSAVAQRTDAAGSPITISISFAGSGSNASVPAGTYTVTYTPPSGFNLAGGVTNPVTGVVVGVGATATVTFAVQAIVTTGTLQINVTGLTGSPANGGSAVAQRTDAAGSPITINVNAAGSGSNTSVPIGTYTVTYTPPSGFVVASGVTNPVTGVVVSGGTATVSFAVTATGTFATPDLVNNASFESSFDGFVSGGFTTPTGVTRDAARAFAGATAVKKALPVTSGSDIGSQFYFPFYAGPPFMPVPAATYDRLWGRFYFYFDAAMNGTLKFQIWEASGFSSQFGGFYCANGSIGWAFIQEWNSVIHPFVAISGLVNGWHSLECDYWRNGDPSGFPSVGIWLDGTQLTGGLGSPPSPGAWSSGRLNAGQRGSSVKLGSFNLLGVLNGTPANTVGGNVWVDKAALSSVGRIGP